MPLTTTKLMPRPPQRRRRLGPPRPRHRPRQLDLGPHRPLRDPHLGRVDPRPVVPRPPTAQVCRPHDEELWRAWAEPEHDGLCALLGADERVDHGSHWRVCRSPSPLSLSLRVKRTDPTVRHLPSPPRPNQNPATPSSAPSSSASSSPRRSAPRWRKRSRTSSRSSSSRCTLPSAGSRRTSGCSTTAASGGGSSASASSRSCRVRSLPGYLSLANGV